MGRFNLVLLLLAFHSLSFQNLSAQDPLRLQNEVEHLDSLSYDFDESKEIILFTGSSSIRKWDSIPNYFPDYQVINTGFGGSQMSDLLYYADRLILKYAPDKVFIYEGDNDIAVGKSIDEIMLTTKKLVQELRQNIPGVELVFISAKPSPARWGLKNDYRSLNNSLKAYCKNQPDLYFADVWNLMLDQNGNPDKALYVEDGLHMTKVGYKLWAHELIEYLK